MGATFVPDGASTRLPAATEDDAAGPTLSSKKPHDFLKMESARGAGDRENVLAGRGSQS